MVQELNWKKQRLEVERPVRNLRGNQKGFVLVQVHKDPNHIKNSEYRKEIIDL